MRRFIILAVSVIWLTGMLTAMGKGVMGQEIPPAGTQQAEPTQTQQILQEQILSLPCKVQDTQMVARLLACYEGPFREDGSNEEVVDVAALVVENAGGTMISEGAVILEWEDDRLVFELYALPPGEKALVLEKNKKPWREDDLTACYGWERREYPENMGHVEVRDRGGCTMLVINHTDGSVPVTHIRYKRYDEESGMYIGGICYEVTVKALAPGEWREINPHHYVSGYSKVVSVTVQIE